MLCTPVKVYYAQIYMQYNISCLDSYQIIIIGVIYMHLVSIDICYTGYWAWLYVVFAMYYIAVAIDYNSHREKRVYNDNND